jgi:hypothetical protein
MQLIGNKIFIRVTKESREGIYSKEIVRDNGEKVRLFINVPAKDDLDERKATLFVQTAIVEQVSPSIHHVKVGDTVIIDYTVCNDTAKFVSMEGEDEIYCIPATTTYHEERLVAYQNRKSRRDQIVYEKGDYDEISPLLGIIRGSEFISNDPYVFLEHESNVIHMVSAAGLLYTETKRVVKRNVLSVGDRSKSEYGLEVGVPITVADCDIFDVTIGGLTIQAVHDRDILLAHK